MRLKRGVLDSRTFLMENELKYKRCKLLAEIRKFGESEEKERVA